MRINFGFDRFSGLYLLAVFIVVFSIWAPHTFPTMATVHILASTQSIAAICALALLVPMTAGQFDLSIGATATLGGVSASLVQTHGWCGPMPAVIIGTLIGTAVGFVNGFAVVKLRVNSFIATLGMSSILAALVVIITGNTDVPPVTSGLFNSLAQANVFGFQSVIFYLVVLALITWWLLDRTPAGRYMRATGGNPDAARLTGIRVDMWAWISLIISGTMSAFAGVLFVSLTGPSVVFGDALLLPAFAAVFLGSTQLLPGKMNVWGTLLAIFALATGVQGLQLVSGATWLASLFNGVALIAAVALAVSRERGLAKGRGARRKKRDMNTGDEYTRLEGREIAETTAPSRVESLRTTE
jgi:ribose transport system permease protein